VGLGNLQINTADRRSVYTVWLRCFVLAGIIISTFVLAFPAILSSFCKPDTPWNEENRILPEGKTPAKTPSVDQPKMTETLRFKIPVFEDDLGRGQINFVLYPDGTIKGVWSGEYERGEDVYCTILAASFIGNIDPAKPCIQNGRHDSSKLYFITSGSYSMLEKISSAGRERGINGLVYVRGWLDPNYTATGELFVTENRKAYDVFSFSAGPVN
jgi:hypothetical protein